MIRVFWRLLLVCAAAAALAVSATPQCKHYTTEELLDRIDSHLALCLPEERHAATLDAFKDVLIANEYQTVGAATDRRQNQQQLQLQPLSVVVVGNAVSSLELFAASVATAIVGVHPARHSVRVLDFATVLADASASNFDLQNQLRQQLASALTACPQRTLFLVRNVQLAIGDRLPLLDVFLDPMNGDRAQLHDADKDRVLDSRRSIFLFLYHTTGPLPSTKSWREFLVAEWQTSVVASLSDVAFTPKALTGRLSGAVQLEGETPTATVGDAKRWREVCSLPHFVGRLVGGTTTTTNANNKSGSIVGADADFFMGIFFAMLAVLVVFIRAKGWSGSLANTAKQADHDATETVELLSPVTTEKEANVGESEPPTPTLTQETPTTSTPAAKKEAPPQSIGGTDLKPTDEHEALYEDHAIQDPEPLVVDHTSKPKPKKKKRGKGSKPPRASEAEQTTQARTKASKNPTRIAPSESQT